MTERNVIDNRHTLYMKKRTGDMYSPVLCEESRVVVPEEIEGLPVDRTICFTTI